MPRSPLPMCITLAIRPVSFLRLHDRLFWRTPDMP